MGDYAPKFDELRRYSLYYCEGENVLVKFDEFALSPSPLLSHLHHYHYREHSDCHYRYHYRYDHRNCYHYCHRSGIVVVITIDYHSHRHHH